MTIILTYGTRQRFRYRTYDLNFMGRVAGMALPMRNAVWSLNGSAETFFYVEHVPDPGIDWTYEYKNSIAVNRLKDAGDFNVEVPVATPELRAGENRLRIFIEAADGKTAQADVTFTWDPTPLSAELDLTDLTHFNHIQEVGQIVDGAFDLDRDLNLIRSRAPVYVDSLLVLGSPHASQEATYQVRFTDFTKVKWLGPSDFFAGHAGPTPPIGIKPGWSTAGMMALNPRNEARSFLAYGDHVGTHQEWVVQTAPPKRFIVRSRVLYNVRHQVQFKDGVDSVRYRIWPAGEPEPEAWLIEENDSKIPDHYPKYKEGSFSLFQHSGMPNEWSNIRVRPL
ncbi:MAG: hypothetical protein KC547_01270 [Anaerolineae bacterium]|nr:hypothetical protein [Anaerolineae bacterium]